MRTFDAWLIESFRDWRPGPIRADEQFSDVACHRDFALRFLAALRPSGSRSPKLIRARRTDASGQVVHHFKATCRATGEDLREAIATQVDETLDLYAKLLGRRDRARH